MSSMKRSLLSVVIALSLCAIPVSAHATTQTPPPPPAASNPPPRTPRPQSSAASARQAARDAAKAALQAALAEAQNGRDLAFADANANLQQSLQAAGKDKVALKAARDAYKAAAQGIIAAYKQAIATARTNYQAALAAIK